MPTSPRVVRVVLAAVVVLTACRDDVVPDTTVGRDEIVPYDTGVTMIAGRPIRIECPNISPADPDPQSRSSEAVHDSTVGAPLAGAIQTIPEFHDCQRLTTSNGPRAFGPLVAIFANEILGTITEPQFTRPEGIAVAQIFNFSTATYGQLGIQSGYSCLYLRRDSVGDWHARLRSYAGDSICVDLQPTDWNGTGGLEARQTTPSSIAAEYPPVARWERDWDNRTHYIGIKCLDGWCEIGRPGFSSSPDYAYPEHTGKVKGWYDEQRLGESHQSGAPQLVPVTRGHIVPVPRLDTLTIAHFSCEFPCDREAGWVHVATAYLDSASAQYQDKLNFTEGRAGNRIYQRRVFRSADERWQSRVISTRGDTAFFRTLRVDHTPPAGTPHPPVPATARWHWRELDETTWNRCVLGCCETTDQRIDPDAF